MKKFLLLAMTLLMALSLVAGCGSDSPKKMVIGLDDNFAPMGFRDENNNIVGFDIDLAQYIADKLGVDMEVTDMEFQSIVPSIQNGEYDFSIAAMYKTDERCEVVDMSKSYCDSGMILAVKEDSEYADTVKSLADCDGLKVAVKEGATSYNVAQSFLDENPDVSYEIAEDHVVAGFVANGFGIAVAPDIPIIHSLNLKVLPLVSPTWQRNFYMATLKDAYHPPVVDIFKQFVIDQTRGELDYRTI